MKLQELMASCGGFWGAHPVFVRKDWQYQVANGDTLLGYWQWVSNQIDAAENRGPDVVWNTGEPPEYGDYLVSDGEEVGVDCFWQYSDYGNGDVRILLPSDRDHPERFPNAKLVRRWARYANVKFWAHKTMKEQKDAAN